MHRVFQGDDSPKMLDMRRQNEVLNQSMRDIAQIVINDANTAKLVEHILSIELFLVPVYKCL